MNKIQMVDLKGQYQDIKDKVDSSIQSVIDSASFINGPKVKEFQLNLENYLNIKHVIPCANGTDALQIAMMGLGLKAGDEVITADFTFAATVEVIALLGLTPVLVDVDPNSFNIDIESIKKAITPKTKAIVPVHLFGQCADMESILKIADDYNLFVIEDNAQAIGATYTFSNGKKAKAGTLGNVSSTSFFPSKNLGCYGDGGAIFTNDDELAHKIRGIVNHGMYLRQFQLYRPCRSPRPLGFRHFLIIAYAICIIIHRQIAAMHQTHEMRQTFTSRHEKHFASDTAFEQYRENFAVNGTARLFAHFAQARQGIFMAVNQGIETRMQAVKRLIMGRTNQHIIRNGLANAVAAINPILQRIAHWLGRKQRDIGRDAWDDLVA